MATTLPTTGNGLVTLAKENKQKILLLAHRSSKPDFDPNDPKHKPNLEALNVVLTHLEKNSHMTPEIKQESQIHKILEVVCLDTKYHFPEQYVARATDLYNRFDAENWGGLAEIKDESDDDTALNDVPVARKSHKRPKSPTKSSPKAAGTILQPPPDHPIWGKNGIMHGIALCLQSNGSLSKKLNPALFDQKKDFRIRGHNGLKPGQWFPNRLAALFAGAHGHSQAGISGNEVDGAWSVVVSGMYEDLDTDSGNTVLYSGSGSHDNEDSNAPADPTSGTRALHISRRTRNVVRLLRTSAANITYAPIEGLRYDGLYRVVDVTTPRNGRGGLYERFKLVREPDQPALSECMKRPTQQELKDYNRINAGYNGYGMK